MDHKKVLIVTYYWPPSGGSGVQRWLKFVKYLPVFGWKPYVFTPENPSFEIKDESLLSDVPREAEIIRHPIWEPYGLVKTISGKTSGGIFVPGSGKKSLLQKLSIWIRGNFFIPDPRVFWVRTSVKFLSDYLVKNQINTLITTGPPHSMHLIGLKLKRKNPSLKWIADFRDPWSEWGFLDSLKIGTIARSMHRKLEKKVLTTADEVLTITPFYEKQFSRLSGRKVNLIPNGYDDRDFVNFTLRRSKQFLLRHVGIVNEKCDPRPFMKAVAKLCEENTEIRELLCIEFVGSVHPAFREFVLKDKTLSTITLFTETVPHKQLIDIYASSAVLILILTGYKDAEGYLPGKLFEYMATGLPVVGVGPVNGDASVVLNNSGLGRMFGENEEKEMRGFLIDHFNSWKSKKNQVFPKRNEKYSRQALTKTLVALLVKS